MGTSEGDRCANEVKSCVYLRFVKGENLFAARWRLRDGAAGSFCGRLPAKREMEHAGLNNGWKAGSFHLSSFSVPQTCSDANEAARR